MNITSTFTFARAPLALARKVTFVLYSNGMDLAGGEHQFENTTQARAFAHSILAYADDIDAEEMKKKK